MELFRTTYHNGAYKQKYSTDTSQTVSTPYFYEMMFIIGEYLDEGLFHNQCYFKEPWSDTFVPLRQISMSGSSCCGENGLANFSFLKPVQEEQYNSKLFVKTDYRNMVLIDGYESSTDIFFLERVSKLEVAKLDIENAYKFDTMPDDIYIPMHVFQMGPEKYFFSYQLKYTKDYKTFCNVVNFDAECPNDNIQLNLTRWDVYRDGGTTEATLVDNYGNEHQLHVDTAFNPERKAIFDGMQYVTLKHNTEEFKQITERIAKFLNIKLFKEYCIRR